MKRRAFLISGLLWPLAAEAAPRRYRLAPGSDVTFTFALAGVQSRGRMPILDADLQLDFASVSRSSVAVTLDAAGASTNLPLADSAMKGRSVLDTAQFPRISFASRTVRQTEGGARMDGTLRVRDIDRPVTLNARFFRQPERAPQDLSTLVIELTGRLSRSAFGATGYPDLVADTIALRMLATLNRDG